MKELVKPLSLLCAVTFVFTSVLYMVTHWPIWLLVSLSVVVQFLCHYIYQSFLLAYISANNQKIEADLIKELSYQTVDIDCPCSQKNKQSVNLRLNDDTLYQCNQCQKLLNVNLDITSTLATVPIKTDAESFDKLLQKAKAPKEQSK